MLITHNWTTDQTDDPAYDVSAGELNNHQVTLGEEENFVSDAQLAAIHAPGSDNQDLSGYELLSNKSTDVNLGASDDFYPSQNAVKTYADQMILWALAYG